MSEMNFDLLDTDLSELADLPEFKTFPDGAHKCVINWSFEVKEGKKSVVLDLTAVESVELNNPTDTPVEAGEKNKVFFSLEAAKDGEKYGEGALKKAVTGLAGHLGTTNLKAILESTQGFECLVVTKAKKSRNSDAKFLQVEAMEVV